LSDQIAWGIIDPIQTVGDKLKQLNIGIFGILCILLVDCLLSDSGAIAIGQAISKNKSIITLILSYVFQLDLKLIYRIALGTLAFLA